MPSPAVDLLKQKTANLPNAPIGVVAGNTVKHLPEQ